MTASLRVQPKEAVFYVDALRLSARPSNKRLSPGAGS